MVQILSKIVQLKVVSYIHLCTYKCPFTQIQLPPQPASLASATSGHQCYSAIYDYTAIEENEVSFVKGNNLT